MLVTLFVEKGAQPLTIWGFSPGEWFLLVQHELLLFAAFFFLIGAIDELAVDFSWLWLKLTGRTGSKPLNSAISQKDRLSGDAAILIPTWQEHQVSLTPVFVRMQTPQGYRWHQLSIRLSRYLFAKSCRRMTDVPYPSLSVGLTQSSVRTLT